MGDKLPDELASLAKLAGEENNVTTTEGLRLLRAYLEIGDSAMRRSILDLVEKVAASRRR